MSKASNPKNLSTKSTQEKTIRLLNYLKRHTDKEHPLKTIKDVKEAFEDKEIHFGSDNTIRDFYEKIADAYNQDEEEKLLSQSEWRIVYDGYIKYSDRKDEFDERPKKKGPYKNLYYVPEFSYEEIDAMIEAVQFSRTLTAEETWMIISKIENELTSEYYRKGARGICKIYEKECCDRERLRENLLTIQQAITDNVQITYRFNGYTRDKKLAPMGDYVRTGVSPYYIVADNGRYYLMAAMESHKDNGPYIIRIDLMTEVTIPGRNEKLGIPGKRRIPKRDVVGLPLEWDENFPLKHINMSYGEPISIKLRIKNKKKEDGCTPQDPVYTFLHDYFGDSYRYRGVDKNDPDYDIVSVQCPVFGMEHFAMQYADRIEVLEPAELRKTIRDKARELAERYQCPEEENG